MDDSEIFMRLEYPENWGSEQLYPEEIRSVQEAELNNEKPGKVCGSEHYRYAAFVYYVKSSTTSAAQIAKLIDAAVADHDDVIAQAAIIDLIYHPTCTKKVYEKGKRAFSSFDEQYFDQELLERAFQENIPSWKV